MHETGVEIYQLNILYFSICKIH